MCLLKIIAIFCLLTTTNSRAYLAYSASILDYNSSDIWRSWLLSEEEDDGQLIGQQAQSSNAGHTGVGSAPVLGRRITPKSVFIAPSFKKCADGYEPDDRGGCVKIVRVNEAAQWDLLLQMLNSMYAATTFEPLVVPNEPPQPTTTVSPSLIEQQQLSLDSSQYYDQSLSVSNGIPEDPAGPFRISMSAANSQFSDSSYNLFQAAAALPSPPNSSESVHSSSSTPSSSAKSNNINDKNNVSSSTSSSSSSSSTSGYNSNSNNNYDDLSSSASSTVYRVLPHISLTTTAGNEFQYEEPSLPSSDQLPYNNNNPDYFDHYHLLMSTATNTVDPGRQSSQSEEPLLLSSESNSQDASLTPTNSKRDSIHQFSTDHQNNYYQYTSAETLYSNNNHQLPTSTSSNSPSPLHTDTDLFQLTATSTSSSDDQAETTDPFQMTTTSSLSYEYASGDDDLLSSMPPPAEEASTTNQHSVEESTTVFELSTLQIPVNKTTSRITYHTTAKVAAFQ